MAAHLPLARGAHEDTFTLTGFKEAFASFFAVLGLTLETWSIPLAFSAALLVAALVQGVAVAATRWRSGRGR